MTNDKSRARFEEWVVSHMPETIKQYGDEAFTTFEGRYIWHVIELLHLGYQASEQRILDALGSEEMVEVVARAMYSAEYSGELNERDGFIIEGYTTQSQAALTAITNKLKGE